MLDLKTITPIGLSAQVIVNCKAGGDCNGGDPFQVYKYAAEEGIPDSSCEQYIAHNLEGACQAIDRCRDCTWPPCMPGNDSACIKDKCWAVPHKKYHVSHYYEFSGATKM